MAKKTKLEIKDNYDDCWIYILLLTALTILLNSIKNYSFNLVGEEVSYSTLGLPFTYLIANYITKKYNNKNTLLAITISSIISVCFMETMAFALGKKLNLIDNLGDFCGYIISQLINLAIYLFILNNTRGKYLLLLVNYIFSVIVFYMVYTILNLNVISFDNYWIKYFLTIGINILLCIFIAFIDLRIKNNK